MANPDIYIGDPSLKTPLLISSIPAELDLASFLAGSIAANSIFIITWEVIPDKPQLSLYNVHFTVRLGTNSAGYEWPYGASIIGTADDYEITHHIDIVRTDYLRNRIATVMVLKNNTASPINFYCFFKTLTFATSMGVNE